MKRLSADDSADSRVKVGHCQASIAKKAPVKTGAFFLSAKIEIVFLTTVNLRRRQTKLRPL